MPTGNRVNAPAEVEPETAVKPLLRHATPRPAIKAKLGQNFLTDKIAAARIVDALGDLTGRTVLEIGPGRGVLTDLLARRASRVIAIELDRVLSAQLRMRYATRDNLEIIEGDILKIDLSTVLGPRPGALAGISTRAPQTVRVVGNIPYYITSDILLRLFSFSQYIESMVVMVQKEVADRLAAKPGSRDYGLFSATAQLYAQVEKLFTLPPAAFHPSPKIFSTVLRMTMNPQFARLQVPEREFIDFLKLSFGQKRKTLVNNLKPQYGAPAVLAALKSAGVRGDARAEALPLEKAAAAFRAVVGSS
jgi:16S rRNA (adenine1518-N6/adenine1519-N6)-dimethyltransferase